MSAAIFDPILFKPFLYDAKLPKFCVKYFFLLTGQISGVFGEFVCGNSWRAGRRSLKFIPWMLHVMPQKKLENDKFLRTALHCEFYIWNIQMWILLIFLFLQGNFQEKLNKLESESGTEGGSSYFGQFLNFQFTAELAP